MTMFADLVPGGGGAVAMANNAERPRLIDFQGDPEGFRQAMLDWRAGGGATGTPTPSTGGTPTPAPSGGGTTGGTGGSGALGAFNTFYNSPAYQVPLNEGLKAVNTKYAALGAIESGAAMKAISDYGAGHAASALGTYMDDLYRQEALGMSASSALAGVGQNLVGQVSANNNAAGSAAGNAILTGGQAAANNYTNIGNGIGSIAGTVAGALGSSYGGGRNTAVTLPQATPAPYLPGAFY
jgi:hypothetical protein